MSATKNHHHDEIERDMREISYNDSMKMSPQFYWNGEPCTIDIIQVRLLPVEREEKRMMWYLPLAGTERQAIAVTTQGQRFLIDNEDGLGWMKVTEGHGMWTAGHASYGPVEELHLVEPHLWNRSYDPAKNAETEAIVEAYWKKEDPEGWERLEGLKKMAAEMHRTTLPPIPIPMTRLSIIQCPPGYVNRAGRRKKSKKRE